MTREQFIKRLEEVGYKLYSICKRDNGWDIYTGVGLHPLEINKKYNFFQYRGDLYSFGELERFLIDKGIVGLVEKEKPFSAHKYLIERGFFYDEENEVYDKNGDGTYVIKSWVTLSGIKGVRLSHTEYFLGVTKQSCDQAIELIERLIKLEGE